MYNVGGRLALHQFRGYGLRRHGSFCSLSNIELRILAHRCWGRTFKSCHVRPLSLRPLSAVRFYTLNDWYTCVFLPFSSWPSLASDVCHPSSSQCDWPSQHPFHLFIEVLRQQWKRLYTTQIHPDLHDCRLNNVWYDKKQLETVWAKTYMHKLPMQIAQKSSKHLNWKVDD